MTDYMTEARQSQTKREPVMSNEARKAFEAQVAKPPMGCEWSEKDGKYVAKSRLGRGALGRYNRDFRIFCEGCIHQHSQQKQGAA